MYLSILEITGTSMIRNYMTMVWNVCLKTQQWGRQIFWGLQTCQYLKKSHWNNHFAQIVLHTLIKVIFICFWLEYQYEMISVPIWITLCLSLIEMRKQTNNMCVCVCVCVCVYTYIYIYSYSSWHRDEWQQKVWGEILRFIGLPWDQSLLTSQFYFELKYALKCP